MNLGIGQMWNEWLDQHDGLSLTDEWRCGGDDSLSTGNAHTPEEDGGELCDEELEPSVVVEELDKGDEEDNRWKNTEYPPSETESLLSDQKLSTNSGEAEELGCEVGNEVEDIKLCIVSDGHRG